MSMWAVVALIIALWFRADISLVIRALAARLKK